MLRHFRPYTYKLTHITTVDSASQCKRWSKATASRPRWQKTTCDIQIDGKLSFLHRTCVRDDLLLRNLDKCQIVCHNGDVWSARTNARKSATRRCATICDINLIFCDSKFWSLIVPEETKLYQIMLMSQIESRAYRIAHITIKSLRCIHTTLEYGTHGQFPRLEAMPPTFHSDSQYGHLQSLLFCNTL